MMTQKEFARSAKVKSYQNFNAIKTGRANAAKDTAKRIAKALGDEKNWPLWADGAGEPSVKRERERQWNLYQADQRRKKRLAEFNKAKRNIQAIG